MNSIRPKWMASPLPNGEAPTGPMTAMTVTLRGRLDGVRLRLKEAKSPQERSEMIHAVFGVGMMRSVCEISRETLPGQTRRSNPQGESRPGRESEHS